jgi:lysophospholipase L1-like esterase
MKKIKILLVFSLILNAFFIAVAIIYYINNKESVIQKATWKFKTESVIVFGDSHTARGNWNQLLDRKDIFKVGYSGFTSGQLVEIMQQYLIGRPASVCFIQCGGNDLNRPDFREERMLRNLEIMIQYLQNENISPVLQSLFHRPDADYNQKIDSLNLRIENLAGQYNIAYINVNRLLNPNNNIQDHLESDSIHLNKKGYEIWGSVISNYLHESGI